MHFTPEYIDKLFLIQTPSAGKLDIPRDIPILTQLKTFASYNFIGYEKKYIIHFINILSKAYLTVWHRSDYNQCERPDILTFKKSGNYVLYK